MNRAEQPWVDSDWDYKSIWETIGEMQNSLTKMITLLSSEKANSGNDEVDRQLLQELAKVEGDCFLLEKTLKPEDEVEIHNSFLMEQHQESIAKPLKESVFIQKLMQKSLSHLSVNVAVLNQTIEKKKL